MTAMTKYLLPFILALCLLPVALPAQEDGPENILEEAYDPEEGWEVESPAGFSPAGEYKKENIKLRELDRDTWQKAAKGLDFSKDKKPGKRDEQGEGGENPGGGKIQRRNPFHSSSGAEIGMGALKVLVALIAVAALFFLIRSLLGLKAPRNRKLSASDLLGLSIEQIEERFQELELDDYIQQAITAGNYALAIRLYFLSALKTLSAGALIHWKKDKTNRDYLRELRGSTLLPAFQELTYIFEWVWYGQRSIGKEDFERLEPKMKRFVQRAANLNEVSTSQRS